MVRMTTLEGMVTMEEEFEPDVPSPDQLSAELATLDPLAVLPRPRGFSADGAHLCLADADGIETELSRASLLTHRRRKCIKKIALDPGHIGGAHARSEDRSWSWSGQEIREGDLNLRVALHLERRLLDLGFEVLLTRRSAEPLFTAPPQDLATRELEARAGLLEAFRPDLTLSLHHNATDLCPWIEKSLGIMVFLFGHPLPEEVPLQREELLHRMLDGSHARALPLGRTVVATLCRRLGLPPCTDHLHRFTAATGRRFSALEPGIFLRNLSVLRHAPGPALLVEGPTMNHCAEAAALAEACARPLEDPHPRIVQYAEGLYEALAPLSDTPA